MKLHLLSVYLGASTTIETVIENHVYKIVAHL